MRHEITEPTINGEPWELIHINGIGTYAEIWVNDERESLIIEEYADPVHRELWDNADLDDLKQWAVDDIIGNSGDVAIESGFEAALELLMIG